MSAAKLELLNKYRADEGKSPLTVWKGSRHQPMLDAYEAPFRAPDSFEATPEELAAQAGRPESYEAKRDRIRATEYTAEQLASFDIRGVEFTEDDNRGHCPHCGINLDNGVATYADICDANKKGAGDMVYDITCLGCGEEWGPKIVRTKQEDRHTGTGLSIEKNRERKNGVTRPSAGGKCREIWDYLDSVYQPDPQDGKGKVIPTAKMVKEASEELGWNPNNASIEFYQWRKFNGIKGRQ